MELLRLQRTNYNEGATYLPNEIIENYSTLVWTERYDEPGDFLLKTSLVDVTRKLLPEMTFVTLRDTAEVMMVETHMIGRDSKGFPELTVKGRSLSAFLNHRYVESPPGKSYRMAQNYTPTEAACVLLWNALVNPTESDVTHPGPASWFRFYTDSVPNVIVSDSSNYVGRRIRRYLEGGQVLPLVQKFLRQNELGIRTIRPPSDPTRVLSSVTTTGFKGQMTWTNPTSVDALRFDIYRGQDRTVETIGEDSIRFHYQSGDIESPEYIWSIEDHKTIASISAQYFDTGGVRVFDNKLAGDLGGHALGWVRRGMWVSGNANPEDADTLDEYVESIKEDGYAELSQHRKVSLVECKISEESPYKYGQHYFMGDKVTLLAEYGIVQTMRVNEYVRTEDKEGDRGYPGLIVVD